MRKFQVYTHPSLPAEAVKVGFAWYGLGFGMFWMLSARLWWLFALWLLALTAISSLQILAALSVEPASFEWIGYVITAVQLGMWVTPGFKGNEWRTQELIRRGFSLSNTVAAKSKRKAIESLYRPVVS